MQEYDWYKIFNLTEFEALGLVSREYTLTLDEVGEKTILVTKGNFVGMTYEGVFLCLYMNDANPFEFDGHACYVDETTNDVYLGIEIEE